MLAAEMVSRHQKDKKKKKKKKRQASLRYSVFTQRSGSFEERFGRLRAYFRLSSG